ncbi:MAG TPA: chemotaxis protein CheW [Candidatus Enterococcus avicola]|uniref:Chemotaxis protein CheW n=1 Tax=Candidatus Enterococcus avicola TaxID=2838561 RepID=A0A9D2JI62_9ENTE|nr:chemotaxis protein CheW [Candidatus Enterococcus avicola]
MEQYVVFKSHGQYFAILVQNVDRIIEASQFIILPEVSDFILGVYEYQEKMIPIVDVRKKLFREYTEKNEATKVVLCQWEGQSLGLYVEDIVDISYMETSRYEEELVRAALKQGYIEQFLKLDERVVMQLSMAFLFNNQQETPPLIDIETFTDLEEE